MSIYCTYLTTYFGSKLPMFYIGSSSIEKVYKGYHGTVTSKKYKSIWELELKENPHLFKTKILTIHDTRKEAFQNESKFQIKFAVHVNPMFINMAFVTHNGKFGSGLKGIDHPMNGKRHTKEAILKIKIARAKQKSNRGWHHTDEWKAEKSVTQTGKKHSNESKIAIGIASSNRIRSPESREKSRLSKLGDKNPMYGKPGSKLGKKDKIVMCPHCGKSGGQSNMTRYHFDHCKFNL